MALLAVGVSARGTLPGVNSGARARLPRTPSTLRARPGHVRVRGPGGAHHMGGTVDEMRTPELMKCAAALGVETRTAGQGGENNLWWGQGRARSLQVPSHVWSSPTPCRGRCLPPWRVGLPCATHAPLRWIRVRIAALRLLGGCARADVPAVVGPAGRVVSSLAIVPVGRCW